MAERKMDENLMKAEKMRQQEERCTSSNAIQIDKAKSDPCNKDKQCTCRSSNEFQNDKAIPDTSNNESDDVEGEVEDICQTIQNCRNTPKFGGVSETCEKRMLSPSPTADCSKLHPWKSAKVCHGEMSNSEGKQCRKNTEVRSRHLNECAVFEKVLQEIGSEQNTKKFVPISPLSISQNIPNPDISSATTVVCANHRRKCNCKEACTTKKCTCKRITKLELGICRSNKHKMTTFGSSCCNFHIHVQPGEEAQPVYPPHIDELPTLLMSHIFSYLTMNELLCTASLVCKAWYHAVREPSLWKRVILDRSNIVDGDIWNVVSINTNMSHLHVVDCRKLTGQGVAKALAVCSALKELVIIRCYQLKEAAFLGIGEHCPQLTTINFSNSNGVPDEALEKIAANCPNLTELRLNRCCMVSDTSIQEVARCCHKLRILTFQENQRITDISLRALCALSHNMEVLSLHKCAITNDGVTDLHKLTRLTNLDLSNLGSLESDSVREIVGSLPQLNTLNFCLSKNIDDSCLHSIAASCKKLKYLFLVSCSITDEGLISIGQYSRSIEHLDVGWCQDVTDRGATALSEMCPQLKYLGLVRCDQITEACVARLVNKFPHIHYSTFLLDSQRLLEKAKQQGYQLINA